MLSLLKNCFGHDTFRYPQEKVIKHTQKNYDQLVVLPTGSGKSLCYQLPAIMGKGITIVISPLKSLIKDQVDNLKKKNISVMSFYGDTKNIEKIKIKKEMLKINPECHLIYTTPETIEKNDEFRGYLHILDNNDRLDRIVIDEAHCISQWGNNFRPSYRELKKIRNNWPLVPIMALTATATLPVQQDIVELLKFRKYKLYTKSYFRENLKIRIIKKKPSLKEHNCDIRDLILASDLDEESGIIYCQTRKKCESLQKFLQANNISSKAYHAGLKKKIRVETESLWKEEKIKIIIATVAFGMGIDKKNVRFVIHNDIPFSIESYYQEIGRAGRGGETSYCIMYFSEKDRMAAKKLIKFSYRNSLKYKQTKYEMVMHKQNLQHTISLLDKFEDFCLTKKCRHVCISNYLGETNLPKCGGSCDNCILDKNEQNFDASYLAKDIIIIIKNLRDSAYKSNIVKNFKENFIYKHTSGYRTKKNILELFEKTLIHLRRQKFIKERVIKLASGNCYMFMYFLYNKSKQILEDNISIDINI